MKTRTLFLHVGVVLVLCAGSLIMAAPMVPRNRRLPDEVRCLAQLKTLSVAIDEIPAGTSEKDMARLLELFRRSIENQGFEVVEKGDVPRLAIQYTTATNSETVPDGVALTTIIAVYQGVNLLRLNDEMTLPVASVVSTSIGRKATLTGLMEQQTLKVVQMFSRFVRRNE